MLIFIRGLLIRDRKMEDLILENEGLIYHILNQYKLNDDEYYDLGMIGLVKASKTYTEGKGKFSTYACECIKHEVLKDIQAKRCKKRTGIVVSLDEMLQDPEIPLIDTIPADIDIEAEIINKDNLEAMLEAITKLAPKDEKIIRTLYGIRTTQKEPNELAKELNVTVKAIYYKRKSIIAKLRKEIGVWKRR